MVTDPVCQIEFDPAEAVSMISYGEDVYYFCSAVCRKRFLEDPPYWLNEEEEEEPSEPEL